MNGHSGSVDAPDYAVFPLLCQLCGGEVCIIAIITDPAPVRDILRHPGEPCIPPRKASARAPRLWAALHHDIEPVASVPGYQFDQRIAW